MKLALTILALLLVAGAGIAAGVFKDEIFSVQDKTQVKTVIKESHHFQFPEKSIDIINVRVFYFVPRDKEAWREGNIFQLINKSLEELSEFHYHQMRQTSHINFTVYNKPIIGRNDHLFYDSEITQYGNPNALKTVTHEIEQRLLDQNDDVYKASFAFDQPGYDVLIIIYEGVGASGSEDVALLSRSFLTDPQYASYGSSFLAHEFYHTLGLPEGYELSSGKTLTSDIMGYGRYHPLKNTFLSKDALVGFGMDDFLKK